MIAPFDKELLTGKIILNAEDDNIDTIIEAVNEQARSWLIQID